MVGRIRLATRFSLTSTDSFSLSPKVLSSKLLIVAETHRAYLSGAFKRPNLNIYFFFFQKSENRRYHLASELGTITIESLDGCFNQASPFLPVIIRTKDFFQV